MTEEQRNGTNKIMNIYLRQSNIGGNNSLEYSDYRDRISDWAVSRNIVSETAELLEEATIRIEDLNRLYESIPGENLDITLRWLSLNYITSMLAGEIKLTVSQIYKLVSEVKRFTYMDTPGLKEMICVESGINDSLNMLKSKIKSKQAAISIEIDKELPLVSANGSELNQVWFSLLDNALDAIAIRGAIRITGELDLNWVVVKIVDDGPGIPDDMISKIFDPFFTTKPPGHGTGLGLDLARRLVRGHKGDISVKSQPGKTEFRICLNIGNKN